MLLDILVKLVHSTEKYMFSALENIGGNWWKYMSINILYESV